MASIERSGFLKMIFPGIIRAAVCCFVVLVGGIIGVPSSFIVLINSALTRPKEASILDKPVATVDRCRMSSLMKSLEQARSNRRLSSSSILCVLLMNCVD
jgi:hypothetical protein